PSADLRDTNEPVDPLGLPGLHPAFSAPEPASRSGLLADEHLRLREVVRHQRVRPRVGDRGDHAPDHDRRHVLLRAPDDPHRGGQVTAAPIGARRPWRRRVLRRSVFNGLAAIVLVVMAFPVYWMGSTAFKTGTDMKAYKPVWVPLHPTLLHFTDAIHTPYFWNGVENSLIVVTVVVIASIALAFLAAIALAKFRFSGRAIFIVLVIMIQMLPQNALIIPLYVVLAKYHEVNKLS